MAVEPRPETTLNRRDERLPVTTRRMTVGMAASGTFALALGMVLGVFGHELDPTTTGELGVLRWFEDHRNGILTVVAKIIELVDGPKVVPWLLLAMLVVLLILRRAAMALASVLMPGLGWLPGHFAKGWFPRERPPDSLEPVVVYHDVASFPSGHTGFATSITIFVLFALTVWGWRRRWMIAAGIIVVVVVGLSRLYAAAHFPLDVLGGALMAGGTSVALWPLFGWLWLVAQRRGNWMSEPSHRNMLRDGPPRRAVEPPTPEDPSTDRP